MTLLGQIHNNNQIITIRDTLFQHCEAYIGERLQTIQKHIDDIQEALTSETKSSAGDKHETGRAMLQLEREKAGNQLTEIENMRSQLLKLKAYKSSDKVGVGSVVFTSQANYYIAISAGVLKIDDTAFYAISPGTPMAQVLLSKQVLDTVQFREQSFTITQIL